MARTNKVEVEIVAKDEATPTIQKLEKRIDGLEADEARIIVKLEAEKLDKQLTNELAKLHKATGDELTVQMRVVANTEDALRQVTDLGEKLDGVTGTVQTVRVDADTSQAVTNIDKVGKSAASSKSVLANMVGNATQDLGALGGIAGSAGVAIGQMGEYMADAKAEGEGFGSILKNFSLVAGPIAGISIAIGLATKAWSDYKAKQKEIADNSKKMADQVTADLERIETATDIGGSLDSLNDRITAAFINTQETAGDTLLVLEDLGIGAEHLGDTLAAIDQGTKGRKAFFADFLENSPKVIGGSKEIAAIIAQLITSSQSFDDIYSRAMLGGRTDVIKFVEDNEKLLRSLEKVDAAGESFSFSKEIDRIRENLLRSVNGLEAWQAAVKDLGPGHTQVEILERALQIVQDLNKEAEKGAPFWHRWTEQIKTYISAKELLIAKIREQIDADLREAAAAQAASEAIQQQIQDVIDYKVALGDANEGLNDLADTQDEIEAKSLAEVFDLGDKPLDAQAAVQNIHEAMRDLNTFLKDPEGLAGRIPDVLNPDDIDAPEFANKIRSLRDLIHTQIEDAFADDGAVMAQGLADNFVATLMAQTGLSEDFIREQFNIPKELSVLIKPAIDASDEAIARQMLAILKGIPGQGLVALGIETELNNEKLTPQQARLAVQRAFEDLGFEIPVNLVVPEPEQAVRDLEAAMGGKSVTVPVRFVTPDQMERAIAAGISLPGGNFGGSPVTNNIYYPSGTPTQTVGALSIYESRNGVRAP